MTAQRRSWSTCSSRISRSSRTRWTRACGKRRPRPLKRKRNRPPPRPPPSNARSPIGPRPRTRSMTDTRPRLFHDDAEIVHLAERFLARTLSKAEWTHEAHLATTTWLLLRRPDVDVDKDLPDLIRRYNESVGGVNSDGEGYHETITRVFLAGGRLFLSEA